MSRCHLPKGPSPHKTSHLQLIQFSKQRLSLGETEADCLISTQDESYTYNARVNRLNPIQEHTR
jgi:hypothetical protein